MVLEADRMEVGRWGGVGGRGSGAHRPDPGLVNAANGSHSGQRHSCSETSRSILSFPLAADDEASPSAKSGSTHDEAGSSV